MAPKKRDIRGRLVVAHRDRLVVAHRGRLVVAHRGRLVVAHRGAATRRGNKARPNYRQVVTLN